LLLHDQYSYFPTFSNLCLCACVCDGARAYQVCTIAGACALDTIWALQLEAACGKRAYHCIVSSKHLNIQLLAHHDLK
jgi:hypothetical protein